MAQRGLTLLGFSTDITNQNTYTGATNILNNYYSSTINPSVITGNGGILNSSAINIATRSGLALNYTDGEDSVNRIGDAVDVNFSTVHSGDGGELIVDVAGIAAISINENIGAIDVASSEGTIRMTNTSGGTSVLTADSLSAAAGSKLLLELDNNSKLMFDVAPDTVGTTDILESAAVKKDINSKSMYTWATYDVVDGAKEAVVQEAVLSSATSDQFVRVTDVTNAALDSNVTAAAVLIDTDLNVTGSGTLSLATGQLAFYKDASVSIDTIDFGISQGVLNNAGINDISSSLSGTNGLLKTGEGTVILSGGSTYTGDTKVDNGILEITGSITSRIINNTGDGIVRLSGGGQVGEVIGNIELVSKNLTVNNANFDQANIAVKASSSLTNNNIISGISITDGSSANNTLTGTVGGASIYTGSYTNAGHTGYVDVLDGSSASNSGTVDNAFVSGTASMNNSGTVESLNYIGSGSTFTNSGHVNDFHGRNDGTFNNSGTVTVDASSNVYGSGSYQQSNGLTTVDGTVAINNMEINGGVLKGSGYILGDLVVGPNGTIQPGNSPGLLTIDGDFTLEEGANLILEIVEDGLGGYLYDELSVSGDFNLYGDIEFDLGAGLDVGIFETTDPEVDPEFSMLDFFMDGSGDLLTLALFSDSNIKISDEFGETFNLLLVDDGNGGFVTEVSAVPVPAAVWLFGSGLLGLIGVARGKKA